MLVFAAMPDMPSRSDAGEIGRMYGVLACMAHLPLQEEACRLPGVSGHCTIMGTTHNGTVTRHARQYHQRKGSAPASRQ